MPQCQPRFNDFRMLARTLGLLLGLPGVAGTAAAQDLLTCDFSGTNPAQNAPWTATSFLAPNLTFGGWDLGPGAFAAPAVDDAFGFSVNAPGNVDSPLAESLAEDEYLAFTLEATAGTLDLGGKRLSVTLRRDSWHAPMRFALFTSMDGFASGLELFATTSTGKPDYSEHVHQFIFPLQGYDGLTGPVEFRLHAFEAQWGGHVAAVTACSILQPGPLQVLQLTTDGPGSAWGSPGGMLHERGTRVTLSAAPQPGARFLGWQGDVSGTGSPRQVVMDADRSVVARFAAAPPPCMDIGTNLGGIVDWGTDWSFVDVFKKAREWLTRSVGGAEWDSNRGFEVSLDADGWPLELPFAAPSDGTQHFVHTLLPVPVAGDYVLLVEGAGQIEMWGPVARRAISPAGGGESRFVVTVAPGAEGTLFLELRVSDVGDPLRSLRVIMPGFEASYGTQPFHPLFLESLRGQRVLRFMDWQATNASPLQTVAQLTRPMSYTQTRAEGASLEHAFDLASRLGADAWICIPHRADDGLVRELARLARSGLAPGLKVLVEYSNETWNTAGPFSQSVHVQDRGQALGLAPDRWTAGQRYVALRSTEVWRLFEEEFGAESGRIVRVLATQAAGLGLTQTRVAALLDPQLNPLAVMPDLLAIAPYFGRNFAPADIPPSVPALPTVDDILQVDAPAAMNVVWQWTAQHRALADAQGWGLVCYEGGQHFVGVLGAENDNGLTAVLHAANRDPRMEGLYATYLAGLEAAGALTFANFSHVGAWSRWGSWSVLEAQDQPLDQAPKQRALLTWMETHGYAVLRAGNAARARPVGMPPLREPRDIVARPCASPHVVALDAAPGASDALVWYALVQDVQLAVRRAGEDVVLSWR